MSVSNIVSFGFGAWSGVAFVPTLGWAAGEAAAPWTPTLHYHTLEGPSKHPLQLIGPSAMQITLEGPSKQPIILKGSN